MIQLFKEHDLKQAKNLQLMLLMFEQILGLNLFYVRVNYFVSGMHRRQLLSTLIIRL